jgi:hypothetical protein
LLLLVAVLVEDLTTQLCIAHEMVEVVVVLDIKTIIQLPQEILIRLLLVRVAQVLAVLAQVLRVRIVILLVLLL